MRRLPHRLGHFRRSALVGRLCHAIFGSWILCRLPPHSSLVNETLVTTSSTAQVMAWTDRSPSRSIMPTSQSSKACIIITEVDVGLGLNDTSNAGYGIYDKGTSELYPINFQDGNGTVDFVTPAAGSPRARGGRSAAVKRNFCPRGTRYLLVGQDLEGYYRRKAGRFGAGCGSDSGGYFGLVYPQYSRPRSGRREVQEPFAER